MTDDVDTIIVAHQRNKGPKRSFSTWEDARAWNDVVDTNYTLSETIHLTEVDSE